MPTTQEILINAGFDPSDAEIYQVLAENGEISVPQIQEHARLSRAAIYDSLAKLLAKDFIDYRKEGRNAYYKPNHPNKLFGLIEEKKQQTAIFSQEMEETIKQLTGSYNLANKKPGVRFFEGVEGFREALHDSLNAKEIYTFVNPSLINKYVNEVNTEYVKERRKRGINKKMLVPDEASSREFLAKQGGELSDVRFLPKNLTPFKTGVQIYDNKISYFTLRETSIIAIIVEDPDIYDMQRSIFEYLWEISK